MIGQTISHYKIIEKLGEGGMGIVYKAHDEKLDRDVALKFLPVSLVSSPEDVARFEQEAKAISALNHPNIATIYDIGEAAGRKFLVLEYISGGTLKSELKKLKVEEKEFPIAEVINYALQMSEGLGHAHRHQIVHRDVKTDNVMLTEEGKVKLTDFGLAKLRGSAQLTQVGSTVGTAAYMSPEQVRGEDLDNRSDLFSFGIVLYEIATGRLPFRGDHEIALGYSIVNEIPPGSRSIRPTIPASLDKVILRCLEKDREKRYQSAEEIVSHLENIRQEISGTILVQKKNSKFLLPVIASILISLAIVLYFALQVQRGPESTRPLNVSLSQETFAEGVEEFPSWSQDGNLLAFSGESSGYRKIFIKKITSGEGAQLSQGAADDVQPCWSKYDNAILFVRSHQANGKLEPGDIFGQYDGGDIWSIDVHSGKDVKIIENAFNPAVSPDGQNIAFDASLGGSRRIWVADSRGRNPRQVSTDSSEAVVHINPRWSPDGTNIVFQNMERTKLDIKVVNVQSGKMTWVTNDLFRDINPVWSPSGTNIYFTSDRGGGLNIWRIPISTHGVRSGQPQQLTTGAGQDVDIAVSPDGKRLAYSVLKLNADIWKLPISSDSGKAIGEPQQVIATTREDSRGAWSPDGNMIAFNSDRTGDMNVWINVLKDGSAQQLTKGAGGDFQPNWSPDAKQIAFFSSRSGNADIWTVEVSSGELKQLTKDQSLEINPIYSPDGNYIAFQSDVTGRLEPWVMKADGTEQHSIANMEVLGHFMRWSRDGTAVVFRSPTGSRPGLWSAPIKGDPPVFLLAPKGGSHISFSPKFDLIMDVVGHKEMWLTPLTGRTPEKVFEFNDPEVRIDYPVWSPDGKWILFDRVKPQGGDIWLMENVE